MVRVDTYQQERYRETATRRGEGDYHYVGGLNCTILYIVFYWTLIHRKVMTAPKKGDTGRGPWKSATIGCFRRDSGVDDRCG